MALKVSNKNRKKLKIVEPIIISEPTIIESSNAFSSSDWVKQEPYVELFEQKVFTLEKKSNSFLQKLIKSFTF